MSRPILGDSEAINKPQDVICIKIYYYNILLNSQNTTIHILRSMNVVLKSDPDASAESLVRQGGESMVLTLGNVMNAAAKNARVKTDTRTEAKTDSNQEQVKLSQG